MCSSLTGTRRAIQDNRHLGQPLHLHDNQSGYTVRSVRSTVRHAGIQAETT